MTLVRIGAALGGAARREEMSVRIFRALRIFRMDRKLKKFKRVQLLPSYIPKRLEGRNSFEWDIFVVLHACFFFFLFVIPFTIVTSVVPFFLSSVKFLTNGQSCEDFNYRERHGRKDDSSDATIESSHEIG